MKGLFKKDKKEKTKTPNAPKYSSGLMENILNRPYQPPHPTLPSTLTAPGQMQAASSPSSFGMNDVMVSSLASDVTQTEVGNSGSGPFDSTLGHIKEHNPSNKREQEKAFNEVCDCLTKSEVGIVGIHGMGGVGKTTLMKVVCNNFLKPHNFKVIWMVVSKTVNEDNIQKSIMRELNLTFYEDQDRQARGMVINETLFNGKDKVALLLDDVWEALDLDQLGVAGGCGLDKSKFKIIFTTRSEDVCLQMDPDQKMKIECLGPEESWALFKQSVGDKPLNSHNQIIGLAKEVAKECAGLPLALTVIGKAMMCKTSPEAWKDSLNSLRHYPSLFSGAGKNLFERLKFSYDNLENQVEKECFLFCCMYPEDQEINKDSLVGSWIGEGLLDVGYGTYEETCNRGHNIIDTLVAKSLLEVMQSKYSSSTIVKMHDVIRDMGLWIGLESNYFVHTASLRLSGEEISKRWNMARRIYVENHNDDIPQELDSPNLSSLHICCATNGLDMVGIMNSTNFKCKVKVLIMENVCFRYSPISTLGQFVGLRHLEIIKSNMEALPPDIGNLTKLLVLILIGNNLATLPPTIGGLCELRKFQISCFGLKNIPSEVGNLKKLEMVDISTPRAVYEGNIFNDCTELRRLHLEVQSYIFNYCTNLPYNWNQLEELCIKILGNDMTPENGPFLIESLKRLTSLKVLTMDGWPIADGDEAIFVIGAMCQLRELRIIRCSIHKLVIRGATDFLPQLEVLEIYACGRLKKVHFRKRALQSLCILKIRNCDCLADVVGLEHLLRLRELVIAEEDFEEGLITTTNDDGHGLLSDVQTHSASFPNLQRLGSLRGIKGLNRLTSLKILTMDRWPIANGDEVILALGAMCQLRELRIIRCRIDKLVIPAPTDFLHQLKLLEIKECHRLEKVHFRKRTLQSLWILKIFCCVRLAHVVGLQHLLRLRVLDIADLPDFGEVLITTTDDDGHGLLSDVQTHSASFPNLQRLRLRSLRRMKHICNDNVSFPSLSELRLYKCPRLEKLPRGLMNENKSTPMISGEIVGTEEWWEGLEWEDDAFEAFLRPLFVECEDFTISIRKYVYQTVAILN